MFVSETKTVRLVRPFRPVRGSHRRLIAVIHPSSKMIHNSVSTITYFSQIVSINQIGEKIILYRIYNADV